MIIEYKNKFLLKESDFNKGHFISMTSILDIFQDVASTHAEKLKVGFEDLHKLNRIWAVVRTKITIVENPKVGEEVLVRTWPLQMGKIDADRCYEIHSLDGNLLIKGISKWVNVDLNTRRIVRMNLITYGEGDYDNDHGLLEGFYKIENYQFEKEKIKVRTSLNDVDNNQHINNAKYMNYIIDSIKELQNKEVIECQIDYIKELYSDNEIELSYIKNNNEFTIKGEVEGNISFTCKIVIKEND